MTKSLAAITPAWWAAYARLSTDFLQPSPAASVVASLARAQAPFLWLLALPSGPLLSSALSRLWLAPIFSPQVNFFLRLSRATERFESAPPEVAGSLVALAALWLLL